MRVLLDPGHGGRSEGTLQGYLPEKEINLRVALGVAGCLKEYDVLLTREGDEYLSLSDRVEMAERVRPDIFLSIHHNAYEEEVPDRSEIYTGWHTVSPSYDLAYAIYEELNREIPGRKMRPPLPSTYTVMQRGPDVRLLTELFFAREMDDDLIAVEVRVLCRALKRFLSLSTVPVRDPDWSYGRWSYLPGHRTTRTDGYAPPPAGGTPVVVLRDGRAFWYGLHLARLTGGRYEHAGMTEQKGEPHVALSLTGYSGPTVIVDVGPPLISYYHGNRTGESLAAALSESLGIPYAPGSSYLLIHLFGPRVIVRTAWNEETVLKVVETLKRMGLI